MRLLDRIPNSYLAAAAILAVLILYFGVRSLANGADASDEGPIESASAQAFLVGVADIGPENRSGVLTLRGRTEALRKVTVRAEVGGVIEETPVDPGTTVASGATLCKIAVDARQANYNQAKAGLDQAQLEYNAARQLFEKGHRSETALLGAKAQRDLAKAQLEQAELQLTKTNIGAPFDGVFDDRMVEVGDFVSVGDPCGLLIQKTPFLVVANLSEADVAKVAVGNPGRARLSDGSDINGTIRHVSKSADNRTRTFRVELEVDNSDFRIRDGLTADLFLNTENSTAYNIPRSAVVQNDAGVIGIHAVNAENIVEFHPIEIVADGTDTFWVSGLKGDIRLVTRGQNYVTAGQTVRTAVAEAQI